MFRRRRLKNDPHKFEPLSEFVHAEEGGVPGRSVASRTVVSRINDIRAVTLRRFVIPEFMDLTLDATLEPAEETTSQPAGCSSVGLTKVNPLDYGIVRHLLYRNHGLVHLCEELEADSAWGARSAWVEYLAPRLRLELPCRRGTTYKLSGEWPTGPVPVVRGVQRVEREIAENNYICIWLPEEGKNGTEGLPDKLELTIDDAASFQLVQTRILKRCGRLLRFVDVEEARDEQTADQRWFSHLCRASIGEAIPPPASTKRNYLR